MKMVVCAVLALGVCAGVFGLDSLEGAIAKQTDYIIRKVPERVKLAIVNVESGSRSLSEYVIERFPDSFLEDGAAKRKGLSLIDRSHLDAIRAERDLQYSGEVDDKDAVSLGRMAGASIIVTGKLLEEGDHYAFSIKILDVESAKVLGSNTVKLEHDELMEQHWPDSRAARASWQNAEQKAAKDAENARKLKEGAKNVLGIFTRGTYLGYLGSVDTPYGFSWGGINEGLSCYLDAALNVKTPDEDALEALSESSLPASEEALTARILGGFNLRVIKGLLFLTAGGGLQVRTLATKASLDSKVESDYETAWLLSGGALVKIWYFYAQAKYVYVFGNSDIRPADLGNVYAGAGFVWKK